MPSDHAPTQTEHLRNQSFTPPPWMDRGEKRLFRTIIRERFDAKERPSTAEIDRIADYIASRGRIALLRNILAKDHREIAAGSQVNSTKARILQASRQLDAAERQSHQLAADLGLL